MERPSDHPLDVRLLCPKDGVRMEKVSVDDVTLDRCPGCGAIWVDVHEMKKVLSKKGLAERVDTGPGAHSTEPLRHELLTLKCPRDHSRMITMVDQKHPRVRFESCKVCGGALLDAGELRELTHVSLMDRIRDLFHIHHR